MIHSSLRPASTHGLPKRAELASRGALPTAGPAPSTCSAVPESELQRATLAQAIEGVIARNPALQRADWGFVVADEEGKVLYEHEADDLMTPASSLKLVTGAAAIQQLGADTRLHTRLLMDGNVDAQGVLHGNLYLVGGGDPTLRSAHLREALNALPFKAVDGDLVVDHSAFDDVRTGRGWSEDDLSLPYAAECDGLMLDANVTGLRITSKGISEVPAVGYLDVRNLTRPGKQTVVDVDRLTGTNTVEVRGTVSAAEPLLTDVTVHEPARYAGAVLASMLSAEGVRLTGSVRDGVAPADLRELWHHESPTLRNIESAMLKNSNNLYAETFFHAVAHGISADAPALEKQLLGIDTECILADGSGLSRENRVTPRQLIEVVREQYRDPAARDCLAIAGVDGTLKNRLTDLKGKVHAKTGTLRDVTSLAGWLTLTNGHALSFAWICNGFDVPAREIKATEDALLRTIRDVASRSTAASSGTSRDPQVHAGLRQPAA